MIISYVITVWNRHRRAMFLVFVVLLLAATAYTLTAPKQYESRLKVLVKHERANPVLGSDVGGPVVRSEVSESDVNSEIELLTSNQILRDVAVRNQLDGIPGADADSPQHGEMVDRAVRRLRRDLSVSPARRASIIQVTYVSENPEQSVTVLQTLATLYLENHLKVHRSAGAQEFFKSQAAEYEEQLAAAQARLAVLRQHNDVVLLLEQKELIIRRVMELEAQANEAAAGISEVSARMTGLRNQLGGQKPRLVTQSRVVPNQYSVERLNTMLAEMRNRRSDLLVKFRADDRLVVELDSQIKETSDALARAQAMTSVEETSDVNPLYQNITADLTKSELQLVGLEARSRSLGLELGLWRDRLRQLDSATVEHERLSREVKLAEEKLVLYSQKQEEARIADALDHQKIGNVSIAEAPVRPYLPSKPNVPLNLTLGFVVALFAAIGTAFALEVNRDTFESESELEAATSLPVLASIPAGGV